MEKQNKPLGDALKGLEGQRLNSVEFVEDYVQFRFDGGCLTAYTLPKILREGRLIEASSPDYRESLYRLGGNELQSIDLQTGVKVTMSISGGEVSISLRDEDYSGPEALQLIDSASRTWVV